MAGPNTFEVAEIFGYSVNDQSTAAWKARNARHCRFRNSACTKDKKDDPLGICSLTDGVAAAAICPVRYLDGDRLFSDAAKLAFGEGVQFGVFPEIRILKIQDELGEHEKKIGKVDFVLGQIKNQNVIDFAAVEVQASYFSGLSTRPLFNHFMKHRDFGECDPKRRPDFRSSAQKRLVPQLQLKVPVFRRWGKKFFVVTDTQFFGALPEFSKTTMANSELTWLTYPIVEHNKTYVLGPVETVYSAWDDVQNSLREGSPPEPKEIVDELDSKLSGPPKGRPRILKT